MHLLKNLTNRIFLLSVLLAFSFNLSAQSEAEQIFKSTCTACHTIGDGKMVGPDLKDVLTSERFVNEDDPVQTLINYVQNPAAFGVIEMPPQALTDDEIKGILTYINEYVPEVKPVSTESDLSTEEGMSANATLFIYIIILLVLIFVLTSVKNSLKESLSQPTESVSETVKNFVSINRNKLIIGFVLFITILNFLYNLMMGVGVVEKYQPAQPIEFSHKIHAGDNGIDCNYCHSSARNSKTAGVPSANVCMNCHTMVTKGTNTGTEEISKIHDAVGYDAEKGEYIEGYEQKPIEWVRVHTLPDLTYFNHSQHVTVGDLECQQCHGNMQEKTLGQVATMEELNSQNFNVKDGIEFKHATLTMGWCIDCHRQKEVNMEDNDYYTEMHEKMKVKYGDEKLTVDKIGGLECGKCHY